MYKLLHRIILDDDEIYSLLKRTDLGIDLSKVFQNDCYHYAFYRTCSYLDQKTREAKGVFWSSN